ncbi:MAG: Rod binding domain-containing protein [Rhodothermales bacterium]|jgi:Rod binding domain-containing protein
MLITPSNISPDPTKRGDLNLRVPRDPAGGISLSTRGKNGTPENPAEAARKFEEVLVREFVKTMTKDLFSSGLAGDEGAGWVKAQGNAQGDALTDALTKHLVDSGTLGISEMLMKKWASNEDGALPEIDRVFQLDIDQNAPLSLQDFMSLRARQLPAASNE